MVVRMQVTLDAEVHRRAKSRAGDLGISFAEYVRRVVDQDLGEAPRQTDASQIFGLFDSGSADIAREKDSYIGAAVRDAHPQGGR
jgi:hypothetical protein